MGRPLAFTIFGVLVVAVILVGLNSITGLILGFMATALLVFTLVQGWRSTRRFFIMMVTGFLGIFLLTSIYGLVFDFVATLGGIATWQETMLDIFHVLIAILVVFVCPVCVLTGAVGMVGLIITGHRSEK